MEPAFNPGGMVLTRPAEMEDIKVGDAILFIEQHIAEETRICHRVVDIKEIDSQLFFQTQGDANEYPDPDLVSSQNFIGKTIYYLPHIGNMAYRLRLNETPITLMGMKFSVALLIILALGLTVIGAESKNMWERTFTPHLKRHQEMLKKRKERLAKRKKGFFTG